MSQPWTPLPYMLRAANHLASNRAAGLPFEPGGRKTSITLKAFSDLHKQAQIQGVPWPKMLVVAPLRMCRLVWPAEIQKWQDFAHLRVSLLLGPAAQREKALKTDADVYVINPENVVWLTGTLAGQQWPFTVTTLDELTRWKKSSGQRAKTFRPFIQKSRYRWGLTGSLTSNGYADIFGQQLMLDDGAALGRFITRFREQYMSLGYDGYTWELQPGAQQRIAQKIAPYWYQIDPAEYAQLPEIVDDIRICPLEPAARKAYETLERDSILALGQDEVLSADNSAALYSKLAQLANGALYTGPKGSAKSDEPQTPDGRPYRVIHDAKLDALEELLDDLNGTPVLLGYEYQHDLERIKVRFDARFKGLGGVPHIGSGVNPALEAERCAAWNGNRLPLLCAHPAAIGHGLNLQEGAAAHVAWFSTPWSWELYDQFCRRVRRSGNTSQTVFNHLLMVPGTIDDLKLTAVKNKFTNHQQFSELLGFYVKGERAMTDGQLPPGWTQPIKKKDPTPSQEGMGQAQAKPIGQFGGGNGVDAAQSAEQRKLENQKEAERVADAAVEKAQQAKAAKLPPAEQRQKIRDSVAQMQGAQVQPQTTSAGPELSEERVHVTLSFSMDVKRLVQLMR